MYSTYCSCSLLKLSLMYALWCYLSCRRRIHVMFEINKLKLYHSKWTICIQSYWSHWAAGSSLGSSALLKDTSTLRLQRSGIGALLITTNQSVCLTATFGQSGSPSLFWIVYSSIFQKHSSIFKTCKINKHESQVSVQMLRKLTQTFSRERLSSVSKCVQIGQTLSPQLYSRPCCKW